MKQPTACVTEEQAAEKVCPFTLNGIPPQFCRGAQCMAWRYSHVRVLKDDPLPDIGYCGLVGQTFESIP